MTLSVLVEHVIVFLRKNMVKLDHSSHWLGYFWSFNASTRAPSFQMLFIMSSSVLTIQGTWNCSSMKGGSLCQLYKPWNILSSSTGAKLVICMRVRSNLQRSLPVRCLGTLVKVRIADLSCFCLTYLRPSCSSRYWTFRLGNLPTTKSRVALICLRYLSLPQVIRIICLHSKYITASSTSLIKLQLFLKGSHVMSCLYLKLWMAV